MNEETPNAGSNAGPGAGSRAEALAALRDRIRSLEGWGQGGAAGVLPFGLPDLDAALPGGGLPLACLHDILPGEPPGGDAPHDAAATGFAAALAARLSALCGDAPVLWLSRSRDLYPPGLLAYGLTPARLLAGRTDSRADLLWALEEAARSAALAAVIGEGAAPGLAESRRLQLAAEAGGVTLLLLGRAGRREASAKAGRNGAGTTAVTRWEIAAAPGPALAPDEPGVGETAWNIALTRCRGGRPGRWTLLWRGPAGGFALCDAGVLRQDERAA
ncbi:MAG: hypothetical protein GVY13_14445 [Alphaproteobacteria bacterium]|jgi:protein ImuA|nr:hypothetical protein [Alphaproteobacteria bacterium]